MKKSLIIFSMISLAIAMSGLSAIAQDEPVESEDPGINTGLVRSDAGGAAPIVKAKWEMWDAGKDDCDSAGAQFKPKGVYQENKKITICGIVTDPDGLADITDGGAVYGDIYYPEGIKTGPSHPTSLEGTPAGCGKLLGTECRMNKLTKADGISLFCNKIRNYNNNLPTFYSTYGYDEICKDDGELMKETAAVFCCDKTLSYEDPSGDYRTLVFGQDKAGKDSNYLENTFKYMPVAAFEVDFKAVNYGNVKLNTHKIINGDLNWDGLNNDAKPATVRNVGNTRIEVSVKQDDMGLGMTGTSWNVRYDGRIGSDASFRSYDPEVWQALDKWLNLSAMDEMDFSIDIFKFPPAHPDSYTGHMSLKAHNVAHLTCTQ